MIPRQELAERVASLAVQAVYIGTSSWKYPGWCGTIYDRARYEYRGKFAESRFKRDCLREYAEVFKTVCVDAAYHTFPSQQYLEGMVNQTPEDFLFGLKVTDAITIKKYPKLARFEDQAGKANENYLNAELFTKAFLKPCEAVRPSIGLLMFEFSRFWPSDYEHGREFIADLDQFLGQLPEGWPYGVEMRNRNWLKPEYFDCLARHRVAHVFNSWEAMPPVGEQMVLTGQIGELLVTARRKGQTWYLGGMSAKQPRDLTLPLSFLGAGRYTARIWEDAPDAESEPNHLATETLNVRSTDTLSLHFALDGGFVARLAPASE